jgi:hypothetical protein
MNSSSFSASVSASVMKDKILSPGTLAVVGGGSVVDWVLYEEEIELVVVPEALFLLLLVAAEALSIIIII